MKFSTFLPYKCIMSTYDNYFSNFGRPLIPDDLCEDSAIRYPRFWRRRFLKVFTTDGHGNHLGQRTTTILAIFRPPNLRRIHMKCEQNWLRSFRGEFMDRFSAPPPPPPPPPPSLFLQPPLRFFQQQAQLIIYVSNMVVNQIK